MTGGFKLNKKKKSIIGISLIFLVGIVLISFAYMPRRIIKIESNEVSSINIFNGNNGEEITLTSNEEISHIINNLNKIKFRKSKCSLFYCGYSFNITIFDNNNKEYKEFIINSNDTLRGKMFFYIDKTKSIDFQYLNGLFD